MTLDNNNEPIQEPIKVQLPDIRFDELLTPAELAKILKRPVETLNRDRSRGRGMPYIKLNGSIRYRVSDLERWLESNRIVPTKKGASKTPSPPPAKIPLILHHFPRPNPPPPKTSTDPPLGDLLATREWDRKGR